MARVLVCDGVSAAGVDLLRPVVEVVECGTLGEEELAAQLQGCDAVIVRSATKVTARALEHASSLKVVARAGAGIDNIDVAAATRRGVLVVNSSAGNTLAAAEHTLAMLLAAARNIPQANASMKAGQFDRKRFMGRQIAGKTLGIVGLGRIGAEVARRARALGMELVAFDPYVPEAQAQALGLRLTTLDEVLASADFLTIHTPLNEETRGLIGRQELAKLRPAAILINCARGGIVDEAALIEALRAGRIAGAALDVFEQEPTPNRELVEHPAVIATPHLGASTSEAQEAVAVDVAEQVLAVLAGRPPRSPVNLPALSPDLMVELEPYLRLADHLGRLAGVLTPRAPSRVAVSATAPAPVDGLPLLCSRVICALLEGHVEEPLNDVNALVVARERGMEVTYSTGVEGHGYVRYMTAEVEFQGGACRLAGAVMEGTQPRIVAVDGYTVDVSPEGEVLFIWKREPRKPGFIGAVGTMLGQAGVGIVNIQVGREEISGLGLLVARTDQRTPACVMEALLARDDVARVARVCFGET